MPEVRRSVSQRRAAGDNGWSAPSSTALGLLATLQRYLASAWRSLLATHDTTPKLSALHRLTTLYLMLPVLIWLLGWFHWWLGVPVAVLLGLALWPAVAGPWRPSLPLLLFVVVLAHIIVSITSGLFSFNIEAWFGLPATALLAFALWKALSGPQRGELPRATMALLLVAAGLLLLSAAGGVFDLNNLDWPKHRALFVALSSESWPAHIPSYFSTAPLLRYSLGYYLVPGLVGQWLGLAALNWAVPLWTWCGVALLLLLFTRAYRGGRAMLATVVFICFGGMDLIGEILFGGWNWITVTITFDQVWPTIDLGRSRIDGLWSWSSLHIKHFGSMFNLLWAPQHFIPATLCTLLLFQLHRHPRFLAVSGLILAASLFWSSFVALGLLPLVGVLLLRNGLRPFLRWPNLLLAPPLAGLLGIYLASGAAENIPRGWLWESYGWEPLVRGLLVFYLLEFVLLATLLWLLRPQLRREPFFLAALATLLLVPWYKIGVHNDFVPRVSLPALVLLCYYTADTLAGRSLVPTGGRFLALVGLIVVLGLGVFNPLFEVVRANNNRDWGGFRYEQHSVSYWGYLSPTYHGQYVTYDFPAWYHSLLREKDVSHANISIEKGDLIIRSHYDVYLDERNRLIYVKEPCSQADIEPRFFLHIYPVDGNDLPAQRRQRGYDNLDFSFPEHGFRSGGKCLAIRQLPRYAISRFKTGQFTSGEGRDQAIWEGSLAVGE